MFNTQIIMILKYLTFIKHSLLILLIGLLDYLIPLQPFIQGVGMLVFIDFATKILAVILKEGVNEVTSTKMGGTFIKFLIYTLGIIGADQIHKIANTQIESGSLLIFAMASVIAIREFKSIVENMEYATGHKFWEAVMKYIPLKTKKEEK